LSDEQQCAIATAAFDLLEMVDSLDLPHTPHIAYATVTPAARYALESAARMGKSTETVVG
jgi:hypothetical protein